MDRLVELGIVTLERASAPNGNETFYWIDLPDGTSSKVSMLSRSAVESGFVGKKYGMTRDVTKSKLSSTSAYGFIKRLESEGVFGDKAAYDVIQEVISDNGKKSFNQFPLVNEGEGKIEMGESGGFISIVNLQLPSRMPSISYSKKSRSELLYKEYLVKERKIDADIIERDFSNKNICVGNFYSCINYTKYNLMLYSLSYIDAARAKLKTYETVSMGKDGKMDRGHLKNIKIKGRSHIIKSEVDKPKSTIFTEAVVDNYSLENIFRLSSGFNEKDYNYVGLTSVGNIQGWLEYNLNIKINFKEDKDTGSPIFDISYIQKKLEEVEDQVVAKEKLAEALKTKRLHFVVDELKPWTKKEGDRSLYRLQKTLAEIDSSIVVNVIRLNDKNKQIDLKNFSNGEGCMDYILDSSNLNDFFRENNVNTTYLAQEKAYSVKMTKRIENFIPLNAESVEVLGKVRDRFISLTNTDSMVFAFDNDIAALPKLTHLKNLCELLRLDFSVMIPTFEYNINDNNDILKKYRELIVLNKESIANNLIEQFSKQIINNKNKLPDNFEEIMNKAKGIDLEKSMIKRGQKKSKRP